VLTANKILDVLLNDKQFKVIIINYLPYKKMEGRSTHFRKAFFNLWYKWNGFRNLQCRR